METLPKILIVDDDKEIRSLLIERLLTYGFNAHGVDGSHAMHKALAQDEYALLALDIMLKGENGLNVCKDLRASSASYCNIPIIFLSALDDTADKIVGLELGGDDYLAKPFETRELVARIKAILRRTAEPLLNKTEHSAHTIYRFGAWKCNTAARQLIDIAGNIISLSAAEFRLLSIFLQHPQQVLTREQLVEHVMGAAQHYDRSLDTQISRLRVKLCDDAKNPSLIRTMRGDGYMLAVSVSTE